MIGEELHAPPVLLKQANSRFMKQCFDFMPDIVLGAEIMIYLQLIYNHQDKTKKSQVPKHFTKIWSIACSTFLAKSFGLFVTDTTL